MQELTAYDEAIQEGEIRGGIAILLRLGCKRFGPPEPVAQAELTSIRSLDRIDRLTDEILTASSWKELLATP